MQNMFSLQGNSKRGKEKKLVSYFKQDRRENLKNIKNIKNIRRDKLENKF